MTYFSSLYWAGFTDRSSKKSVDGYCQDQKLKNQKLKKTLYLGNVLLWWSRIVVMSFAQTCFGGPQSVASTGHRCLAANSKSDLQPVRDHSTARCRSRAPGCHCLPVHVQRQMIMMTSAFLKLQFQNLWQHVEIRSDWDLFASKLELKLPEQVPGDLALQARRQPLAVARRLQGQKLPKLSGKYCQGKLSDAKGQADSSQPLCCGPYCIQPWVTPRTAHQASWVNQGLCWL